MKNFPRILTIFLLVISTAQAQQEKGIIGLNNWLNNWTEFKPNKVDYGEANQILAVNITANTKLYKKNIYLLQGNVYVTNNAVLTIEPGTKIIGDFDTKGTLIITKGASIIADGLETDPIVFTSNRSLRKAGDWGGIVILGDAPLNKFGGVASVNTGSSTDFIPTLTSYGGNNPAGNSGIMRYVRIEFAGSKLSTGGGNLNSLFLAGVGNKTILQNIMISFSGGNSFEIFGGDTNLSQVVSYKSSNDDYRFNYGAQSSLTNSLAIRSSFLSSKNGSRCLDIASYNKKEEVDFSKKQTLVVATNLTLVNNSANINADIESGLVKEAIYIAENAALNCKRTVISGFKPAVLLDNKIQMNEENLAKIKFESMYFNNCKGNIFIVDNSNNEDLESYYGQTNLFNYFSPNSNNAETFIDFANEKRPDFRLQLSKITASN
ncbi:hypothetical protein K5V07_00600 [Flavobacterium sp. CHNK8]|uniref:hypothetical protein n=1 Tax=Flavobacterium sp. CHNK8 TaxID=2871165 RepID=UPI001C8E98FE|nr:hypothetical protein [Flavobacterium sp. CHNK8]QZK89068.1 hypothetical protein K5V07_00600 [Flavobacterium sp. CHNK8]